MQLNINFDTYLELEKISNGSFSPLEGFMEEKDFYSVYCQRGIIFRRDIFFANHPLFLTNLPLSP